MPFLIDGIERNCGSHTIPAGFVSAMAPYGTAANQPTWTNAQIHDVIVDKNRRDMQALFPASQFAVDQHQTSACNGWAKANAITRVRKLAGHDDGWVGSGSFIYAQMNGGRDRGSILEDGMLDDHGCCSITLNPYDRIFTNQISESAWQDAAKHRALRAYRAVNRQGWDSGLATGLYIGIAAVHVDESWNGMKGGRPPVAKGPGNHAVCIEDIRWDANNQRFEYLMQNSWSAKWGMDGRCWLTWAHLAQPFLNHVSYLIPATREVV